MNKPLWVPHTHEELESEYRAKSKKWRENVGNFFPTYHHFLKAVQGARTFELTPTLDRYIGGRTRMTADQMKGSLDPKYHPVIDAINAKIKTGQSLPHPILIKRGNRHSVLSGDARINLAFMNGKNPTVQVIDLDKLDIPNKEIDPIIKSEILGRSLFSDEDPWTEAKYLRGGEDQLRELEEEEGFYGHMVPHPLDKGEFEDQGKEIAGSVPDKVFPTKIQTAPLDPKAGDIDLEAAAASQVKIHKNVQLHQLYRSYKHTPHNPLSVYLKYAVHLIENHKDLKKLPAADRVKADEDWLKFHQQGGAAEKNGGLTVNHLHTFIKENPQVIPQLLHHQKQLHDYIKTMMPEVITTIDGEPTIPLVRGLKTSEHGKDHSLASYATNPRTAAGFGSRLHYYNVPLKNVWYSFDSGPIQGSSSNFGPEDEVLVSQHPRHPSEFKTEEDFPRYWPTKTHHLDDFGSSYPKDILKAARLHVRANTGTFDEADADEAIRILKDRSDDFRIHDELVPGSGRRATRAIIDANQKGDMDPSLIHHLFEKGHKEIKQEDIGPSILYNVRELHPKTIDLIMNGDDKSSQNVVAHKFGHKFSAENISKLFGVNGRGIIKALMESPNITHDHVVAAKNHQSDEINSAIFDNPKVAEVAPDAIEHEINYGTNRESIKNIISNTGVKGDTLARAIKAHIQKNGLDGANPEDPWSRHVGGVAFRLGQLTPDQWKNILTSDRHNNLVDGAVRDLTSYRDQFHNLSDKDFAGIMEHAISKSKVDLEIALSALPYTSPEFAAEFAKNFPESKDIETLSVEAQRPLHQTSNNHTKETGLAILKMLASRGLDSAKRALKEHESEALKLSEDETNIFNAIAAKLLKS